MRVAFVLVTVAFLVGCASEDTTERTQPPNGGTPQLGHVHGLGVDPADDTLYVASHFGVFRVEDGSAERVADRWQDTMGFAVVGPGHFLASGHPDLREDLPAQLGLIESTDGAKTWVALSLQGSADLHSIEPLKDRVYAYDSATGALILSNDQRTWTTIDRRPLSDLAVSQDAPDVIYATTPRGTLLRSEAGAELTPVPGAPAMGAIDWEPGGRLVGVTATGTFAVSSDGRSQWTDAGSVDEAVQALDVNPHRWHVATDSGVYESSDDGAAWKPVLQSHG